MKGIKSWAKEDRPREKMMAMGRGNLTDAELIAILLGSGSFDITAVELAKDILGSTDNDLHLLGKKDIAYFKSFHGVGEAKAISIIAALELGRRRQAVPKLVNPKITCSKDAFQLLVPVLQDLPHEEFYLLLLNNQNQVKKRLRISVGNVDKTLVDTRIIFKAALDELCTGIVLAHNHPSGQLKPSKSDITITNRICQIGELFEIRIVDHIIIGDGGYYSFRDEGLLTEFK